MMIHQFLHHRKHIECVLWWNHIVCGHLKQRIIPQIRAWFPTISCTEPHEWEISICIQMWFSHITANVMALTVFIWCNISVQIGGGILINRTQFRCSILQSIQVCKWWWFISRIVGIFVLLEYQSFLVRAQSSWTGILIQQISVHGFHDGPWSGCDLFPWPHPRLSVLHFGIDHDQLQPQAVRMV